MRTKEQEERWLKLPAREREERERVLAVARTFLGTPYHDCARLKGVGVDCATMIAMVFEEAGLEPPLDIPSYSPQWYLHRSDELYMERVLDRAKEIAQKDAHPGDLVLYQFGRCFAHGAIVDEPGWPAIIHAYKQAGSVVRWRGDQGDLAFIVKPPPRGQRGEAKPRPRRFFTRHAWGG